MAIAMTLAEYLESHHSAFEVMTHAHTGCSLDTAATAQVPGDRLAKSVMLKDDQGYVMAVLPSTCHVAIRAVNRSLGGRHLQLAEEWELKDLFRDCEPGAVPAVGPAYGLQTVIDQRLTQQKDVYFEAGDHEGLIHMPMDQFLDLMGECGQARFSRYL